MSDSMMKWVVIETDSQGNRREFWHWRDPSDEVKELRKRDQSKQYRLFHLEEREVL